jgi:RNA-directed DNA polymerase
VQFEWFVPTVRDRIVQSAMLHILEPIFERDFSESSYGFRPGRNARQAVAVVEENLAEGCTWVVDADIKGYFDSIPQGLISLLQITHGAAVSPAK